jgi:TctA family transporter
MLDGYQMARQGRAGPALTAAAVSSFIAGCLATAVIAGFAPPLAEVALKFGPWEYFALMVVGLIGAVVLAHGSVLKAIAMIVLGLILGLVGADVNSGVARFSLGLPQLADGIGFIIIAMGIIAMAEIIGNLQRSERREVYTDGVPSLFPSREDWRRMLPASLRGTVLGSVLGILPGGGTSLAAFSAYSLEKKIAATPARFGKGAIEGVASPEAANNAASQTSFIPMLTLGIPSNAVMALMIGAMTIHSIQPGPEVMTKNPELFPMVGIWIKLLKAPYRFMFPAIMMFSAIGIYSVNGATFDIVLTAAFGLLGFVLMKLGCEPAPLLLGFILGPMMEENLRRAMALSRGDATSFLTRPVSASLLMVAVTLLIVVALPALRRKREEIFQE